jgi:hypothetical protein
MPVSANKICRAAVVETVELTALLSVAECCELLGGLNPKTVMGYVRSGELPAVALGQNGGKPYGIEVADLVAFKAARRVRPPAPVVELAPATVVEATEGAAPVAKPRRVSGRGRRRVNTGLVAA